MPKIQVWAGPALTRPASLAVTPPFRLCPAVTWLAGCLSVPRPPVLLGPARMILDRLVLSQPLT